MRFPRLNDARCAILALGLGGGVSSVGQAQVAGPHATPNHPPLTAYVLGQTNAPAPAMLHGARDAYTVKGAGRDASGADDEGVFAGFETEATHFTFVARVAKVESAGPVTKYGLVARAGLPQPGGVGDDERPPRLVIVRVKVLRACFESHFCG